MSQIGKLVVNKRLWLIQRRLGGQVRELTQANLGFGTSNEALSESDKSSNEEQNERFENQTRIHDESEPEQQVEEDNPDISESDDAPSQSEKDDESENEDYEELFN